MLEKDSGERKKVSKTGDAQIKKAEFLTVGKACKAIFRPASVFRDFTVCVRNTSLQGDGGGGRARESQTDRQTDRQTERKRQTDRQRERKTVSKTYRNIQIHQ